MFRNMRKLANVMLATLIIASVVAVVPAAAQTGGVRVVAPTLTVAAVGNTFDVQINLDTVPAVYGADLVLGWTSSIMSCSSYNDTPNVFRSHFPSINPIVVPVFTTPGTTHWAMSGVGNPTTPPANLTEKLVTFQCTALANGTTPLTLSSLALSDPNGDLYTGVIATNGQVTVGTAPGPDLAPRSVAASAVAGQPQQVNVSFAIANIGTASAVSSQASMTVNGVATTTFQIPTLAAGAVVTPTIANPITFSGSSATVCVTADSASGVAETNENNNRVCVTFSSQSVERTTTIMCALATTLAFTAPADVTNCSLQSGSNDCGGPMAIRSNSSWEVSARDADTTTAGHMTEWTGSAYNPARRLSNAMHVLAQTYNVTLPGPGVIASGSATSDAGVSVPVTFRQLVTFPADPILPSGSSYRIVVTFLAYVTF